MDSFAQLGRKLEARIGGLPPEKVVFVGVGNRFRGDDAAGPEIIDRLKGRVPHAIDAGPAPENETGAVKKLKPAAIVFIDALLFTDRPPGTPEIVEIADIRHLGGSAHTLSLDVVMEYLKAETGADVFMIGVQPASVREDEALSPGVEAAIGSVVADILRALGS